MAEWWTRGLTPILSCDPGVIPGEALTTNPKFRSVCITTPAGTTCTFGSSSLGSTEYAVFRAGVPLQLVSAFVIPQAAWSNPGKTNFAYLGNSCGLAGYWCSSSTALDAGQVLSLGTLSCVAVSSLADLRVAVSVSSCGGAAPALTWQINYTTTG